MPNYSPLSFSGTVLHQLAKSIAVMVIRFAPNDSKFYTAVEIGAALEELPFGNRSSLFANVDHLKLGLMSPQVRRALATLYPLMFDFVYSYGKNSTITKGDNKFRRGFEIKRLIAPVQTSDDFPTIVAAVDKLVGELCDCWKEKLNPIIGKEVVIPKLLPISPINVETENKSTVAVLDKRRQHLRKLNASLRYLKGKNKFIKNPLAELMEEETNTMGNKLISLIKEGNVFTELINGRQTLSITSGLLVQDLISNCGCSVSKIPMIISIVITMLFGLVDIGSFKLLIKSCDTYALAAERTAALVVLNGRRRFMDREAADAILNSYIILDASNKKGKALVAKLYNYVSKDGVVRLGAFKVDNSGMLLSILIFQQK